MANDRDSISADAVGPERLSPSVREHRYFYDPFSCPPKVWIKTDGNAAPTGTEGNENCVFTGFHTFEYTIRGTASDVFKPVFGTSGGYDWKFDGDTAADGVEINFGSIISGIHPRTYRVGTESFFSRLLIAVEDVSGVDLMFGFRKIQANLTDPNDYTDLAVLRVLGNSDTSAADVLVVTNLNNATDFTSQTALSGSLNSAPSAITLADGVEMELEVVVEGTRAKFFVDGKRVQGLTAFDLDSGDIVTPFAFILHTTDLAGTIKTLAVEGGLLEDRPIRTLSSLYGPGNA